MLPVCMLTGQILVSASGCITKSSKYALLRVFWPRKAAYFPEATKKMSIKDKETCV